MTADTNVALAWTLNPTHPTGNFPKMETCLKHVKYTKIYALRMSLIEPTISFGRLDECHDYQ